MTSPADYLASQELGTKMRAAGIQAFEFISARDSEAGINVALFTPQALAANDPVCQTAWLCELTGERVRFLAVHGKVVHDFPIGLFLLGGKLPLPT